MHLPQEMSATMQNLDLNANPNKLQLLGLQGRIKGCRFRDLESG